MFLGLSKNKYFKYIKNIINQDFINDLFIFEQSIKHDLIGFSDDDDRIIT